MSYEDLDAVTARLYRSLPAHHSPEFTADPIAAALGMSVAEVTEGLGRLVEAALVTTVPGERFRLRTYRLRTHAHAMGKVDDIAWWRVLRRRMVEWYLRRAAAADAVVNPFPRRFSPVYVGLDTSVFADAKAALAWAEAERVNLLAAQRLSADIGWGELVYQFSEALWNPLRLQYTAADLVRSQSLGATAARDAGHVLEIVCRIRQGYAESSRGNHVAAIALCTVAAQRAAEVGDPGLESSALSTRARAHLKADDPHASASDLERALEFAEAANDLRGIALRHRRLGETALHPRIADTETAIHHLIIAAIMFDGVGDHPARARTVMHLARARIVNGQAKVAVLELEAIEQSVRDYGSAGYLADLYTVLGEAHAVRADIAEARRRYSQAIDYYTAAGPGADTNRAAVVARRDALGPDRPTA